MMNNNINKMNKMNEINNMLLNRKLHEKNEKIEELNEQLTQLLIHNRELMLNNMELQDELDKIKQPKTNTKTTTYTKTREAAHDTLLRTAEEYMEHNELSEKSMKKIDEIIDTFLMNENINLQIVPDTIERKIYRNIFIVAFGLLDELIASSSIKFLGHEIVMKMQPQT